MIYTRDIRLDKIKGKTLEEAKILITGLNYELRIDKENQAIVITNGANQAVFVVLNEQEKIVSYRINL